MIKDELLVCNNLEIPVIGIELASFCLPIMHVIIIV